jgi:hypothetical protein
MPACGQIAQDYHYLQFIRNRSVIFHKTLQLPASPFQLMLVMVHRDRSDSHLWSPDEADSREGRIFVLRHGQTDPELTEKLNQQLGARRFYEPDFCGGLGSLQAADFSIQGNAIRVKQFYAPGTARSNCTSLIIAKGSQLEVQKGESGQSGLAAEAGRQRNAMHQKALQWMQEQKYKEAAYLWEELYYYWRYGPYAAEGPAEEVLYHLALVYMRLQLYPAAEKILLESRRAFPANSRSELLLADLYRDIGRKAEAIRLYTSYAAKSNLTPAQRNYALGEIRKLQ